LQLVLRPQLVVSLLLPLAVLLFSLPLPQPQCLPSSLLPNWQDRYLPIPVRLWIRSISAFSHSVFQYVLHFLFDFHRWIPMSLLPNWQDRYLPIPVRLWIRSISAFSHSVFQYVLHFLFDFHRGIPMSLLVYLSLH